ncbi:MAG: hypothetical protein EPO08_09380 [Rhodospirillaceae bacterium]|nr:MAG: hypothetical protein EPO08_09380 [Rhodospirillaceae bacterium]
MRTGGWMWAALAVVVGVSMYLVKYKVQALENELISKREQITRDRGEIRVLDAEWTYLNDPGRLRRLSAQYLGFGPAVPQNVVDINALPMRDRLGGGTAQSPTEDTLTATKPVPAMGPTVHAANTPPEPGPFAIERPVGFPVLVARLQRLLFPDAVGATTSEENAR